MFSRQTSAPHIFPGRMGARQRLKPRRCNASWLLAVIWTLHLCMAWKSSWAMMLSIGSPKSNPGKRPTMANQEQLDLLRQGVVERWKSWRQRHPDLLLDLDDADPLRMEAGRIQSLPRAFAWRKSQRSSSDCWTSEASAGRSVLFVRRDRTERPVRDQQGTAFLSVQALPLRERDAARRQGEQAGPLRMKKGAPAEGPGCITCYAKCSALAERKEA